MTRSLDEFLRDAQESGVLSDFDLRVWLAAMSGDRRPVDGEQLARELVKQKKLTKFQAEQIYAGRGKSLTLGNYVILDKLGQGGMGMVLKAEHKRMKRAVALKVMSAAALKSPDAVKRFHREVEAAARLSHPNIVAAFDADEERGTHFLVMEFVAGNDLAQIVKEHGPLPVDRALDYTIQAARGLEHAHQQGLIHRDIKPANLLLDHKGTVKILDMGLARFDDSLSSSEGAASAGLTTTGTIMGTVDYMSPEQALDTKHADARSDLYSLGISLYFLLTGRSPFQGDTIMKKLLAHREDPIPSVRDVRPDVPPELDAVFQRMIAKKPANRFQTMTQVIAALQACTAGRAPSETVILKSAQMPAETSADSEFRNFLRDLNEQTSPGPTLANGGPRGTPRGKRSPATVTEAVPSRDSSLVNRPLPLKLIGAGIAAVVLLVSLFLFWPANRGAMRLEITDEQVEVTVGKTGRVLRGKRTETLKLPVGEHVLHVQIGETTLDTPEIEVAKGKLVEIKVEKVGNRVRVMRGKEFLVAKELPRAKTAGVKHTANAGSSSDAVQNYALEFDGKASYVEIPTLERDKPESLTLEAWMRPKSPVPSIIVRMEGRLPAQVFVAGRDGLAGMEFSSQAPQIRQVDAAAKLSADAAIHVAYVIDERALKLFVNGVRIGLGARSSATPSSQPAFRGTWLGAQPNTKDQGKLAYFFAGALDEVRISKVARYNKDFTPDVRFTPDKDTLALYHFDEGQGSELKDSSGNNHHGKIVGAKWVRLSEGSPAEVTPKVASGSTKREFASDEWIDVLPLIDPALDKSGVGEKWGKNDWRMEGGELRYRGDDKWGKLFFPIRYRGRSLECELEFTRTSSGSGFTTDVPLPGGFKGISVSSDRLSFANQTPNQPFQVVNGQRMKMRFQVRHDGTNDAVDIFVNDKLVLHWDGQLDKIKNAASPSELRDQSEHNGLFMAGNSDYTFHAIRVRMLNGGTAELLRPAVGSAATSPFSDAALTPYDLWTSPDYEWTAPENLGPVVNSSEQETGPCLSADGLTLLFESNRAGGLGVTDLWMCKRPALTAPWAVPEPLGPKVNSNSSDTNPSLSADGLTLMFSSDRGRTAGEYRIWQSTRATTNDPWTSPKRLDAIPEFAGTSDGGAKESPDGLSLFFHSRGRPGSAKQDLWVCRRPTKTDAWTAPENLGPTVNSVVDDMDPSLSSDGRVLVFSKRGNGKLTELWWSSRPSLDAPWSAAQQIGSPIKSAFESFRAALSTDGQTMFFTSYDRTGGQGKADLWVTRRVLTPAAAARTAARPQNAINLLPLIDPAKDSVHGGWSFNPAGELIVGEGTPARIRIPFRPAAEYDLHIEFTRHSGNGGNTQILVAGGHQFLFSLGLQQNKFAQFLLFDGQFAGTVQKEAWLVNGQRHRSLVQIRQGGVKTLFDGVPASELTTNYSTAAMPKDWELGDPAILGIGSVNSPTTFHRIEIVEITGHGTFTRPGDAAAKAAESKRAATSDTFTNTLGMEFVRVPKGKSWLGGGGGKPGTQEVTISEDFYLGKFEVTQDEWLKVMGKNPSHFSRSGASKETVRNLSDADLKRLPVEGVSWNACQEFVTRLNERHQAPGWVYRLPTRAEWEYACRGGPLSQKDDSGFDFTLEVPTNTLAPELARFDANSKGTAQVGSYPPNRLGLHDMHGNVFEWCADELMPDAQDASQRASKGGGFWSKALNCRAFDSWVRPASHSEPNLGLRLARVRAGSQPTAWQPLFNGKDLTGWKQINPKDTGKAEVVADEGQPAVRLSSPYGIHPPVKTRDFHLRLDFKAEQGTKGGLNLFWGIGIGVQARLDALTRSPPTFAFSSYGVTCQEAEFRNGQFSPVGQKFGKNAKIDFTKLNLNAQSPWQRIEALRLGDSMLFLVNGQLAGAVTNLRDAREPEAKALDYSPISIWSDGNGSALFRNIELREITALPPEVVELAAWQPLFNGKDLTGWVGDLKRFSVVNGELKPQGAATSELLNTQRSFGDFTLKAQVWVGGNSGIRLRSATTNLTMEIEPSVDTKGLLSMGRFDTPDKRSRVPTGKSFRPREWCDLELTRRGTSVSLILNGEPFNAADPSHLPELAQLTGPVVIGLEANAGSIGFRDLRVLEHSPAPEAAWQPLFNGKDLTGLTKTNPTVNTGKAEVVLEDGQPALRLTSPNGLATRAFGNYHLRLECNTDHAGGIHHLFIGNDLRLRFEWQAKSTPPTIILSRNVLTFQKAELRDGRIVPLGATLTGKDTVTFPVPSLNPSGWQRVEIVRLDDAFLYSINGKLVGAITNIRTPPNLPGPSPIEFYTTAKQSLFRNIEIRAITTLPPNFPSEASK